MIDISKEILRLADLLKELKAKNFNKEFPVLYDEGMKLFNLRCAELEEELRKLMDEVEE